MKNDTINMKNNTKKEKNDMPESVESHYKEGTDLLLARHGRLSWAADSAADSWAQLVNFPHLL